ncbi:hypothetical protein O3P69_017439 [Scylla paramamosain]|uniref:Uncharacterized protein n=1 Tax=Scylla paramamosain TaxID=85552 RepID=A0AAW0TVP4_SCYPA
MLRAAKRVPAGQSPPCQRGEPSHSSPHLATSLRCDFCCSTPTYLCLMEGELCCLPASSSVLTSGVREAILPYGVKTQGHDRLDLTPANNERDERAREREARREEREREARREEREREARREERER